MSESRFFCAAEARQRNELIYGTAARVDTWLLLETPGAWSAKALPTDRLPNEVQRHFDRLAKSIPRSRRLLIRQRHTRSAYHRLFVVESQSELRTREIALAEYGDLLTVDAAALRRAGAPEVTPEYLVCTHDRHDKCCAKFGFATYCALKECGGEAVWQCSHVGGDRFAANVVFLPWGIYYGNVFPDDAAELVEAGRKGNISLRHYRGRSSYGRAGQVGDYLVRRETGIVGLDALALADSQQIDDNQWRVRFRNTEGAGVHEVDFVAREQVFVELLTCHAEEAAPVTQYKLSSYRYFQS